MKVPLPTCRQIWPSASSTASALRTAGLVRPSVSTSCRSVGSRVSTLRSLFARIAPKLVSAQCRDVACQDPSRNQSRYWYATRTESCSSARMQILTVVRPGATQLVSIGQTAPRAHNGEESHVQVDTTRRRRGHARDLRRRPACTGADRAASDRIRRHSHRWSRCTFSSPSSARRRKACRSRSRT